MKIVECTGYLSGSKVTDSDMKHNREEEYCFDTILNKLMEKGALPLFETYRVFEIHGRVYGSILVDETHVVDENFSVPILNLEE